MLQKWLVTVQAQDVIQIGLVIYNMSIDALCASDSSFLFWTCPNGDMYLTSDKITTTPEDAIFSTDGGVAGVIIKTTQPC